MSKRSDAQNKLLWVRLTEISKAIQWPVNGVMQWLTPEDFKDILSAGLKKEQRIAQGVDGGFVMLGQRTSKMTVTEMKDLMDFIEYFAADRGIKLSAEDGYQDYPECIV